MKIAIPDFALVVLVGPTGSGKSSFARKHFLQTEIVSSDRCRALVSDDETSQDATGDAFDLLHHWAGLRLKRRKLTVIDATCVQRADRAALVALARKHHALPVALVLDIDPDLCHALNLLLELRVFRKEFGRRAPDDQGDLSEPTLPLGIERIHERDLQGHFAVATRPEDRQAGRGLLSCVGHFCCAIL